MAGNVVNDFESHGSQELLKRRSVLPDNLNQPRNFQSVSLHRIQISSHLYVKQLKVNFIDSLNGYNVIPRDEVHLTLLHTERKIASEKLNNHQPEVGLEQLGQRTGDTFRSRASQE